MGLKPYFVRKNKITVSHGLLHRGNRVVVPEKAKPAMPQQLHETHQGICCMKFLARSLLWDPRIAQYIEDLVKT